MPSVKSSRIAFLATAVGALAVATACPWLQMHPEAIERGATPPAGHARFLGNAEPNATYEALSATDKMDYLWDRITANTTSGPWPPGVQFDVVMNESMAPTMQWLGDEFPPGRVKGLHSVGTVAKARIVWNGRSNYTGLFAAPTVDEMLLRMAVVWKPCVDCSNCPPNPRPDYPHYPQCDLTTNFNPSAAFKVLRDGVPSANFFGMQNILSDGSWNPLATNVSTRMPKVLVGGGAVTAKFHSVTDWGFAVGTSDLAMYNQRGDKTEPSALNFPYQIIMEPDLGVRTRFPEEFNGDHYAFLRQFGSIEPGTVLWQVYAKGSPSMHMEHLGFIETVSAFTTSNFGDQKLFFRHQAVEEDIEVGGARVQGWLEECPTESDCPVCPFETPCF